MPSEILENIFLYCVISFAFSSIIYRLGKEVGVEIFRCHAFRSIFQGGGRGQSVTENELLIIIKLDVKCYICVKIFMTGTNRWVHSILQPVEFRRSIENPATYVS